MGYITIANAQCSQILILAKKEVNCQVGRVRKRKAGVKATIKCAKALKSFLRITPTKSEDHVVLEAKDFALEVCIFFP